MYLWSVKYWPAVLSNWYKIVPSITTADPNAFASKNWSKAPVRYEVTSLQSVGLRLTDTLSYIHRIYWNCHCSLHSILTAPLQQKGKDELWELPHLKLLLYWNNLRKTVRRYRILKFRENISMLPDYNSACKFNTEFCLLCLTTEQQRFISCLKWMFFQHFLQPTVWVKVKRKPKWLLKVEKKTFSSFSGFVRPLTRIGSCRV